MVYILAALCPPPCLRCSAPCAPLPTAAIKFPVQLEKAWLLASALGFTLDVGVYHTFSLFVRSVMKLLVSEKVGAWGRGARKQGHPCTLYFARKGFGLSLMSSSSPTGVYSRMIVNGCAWDLPRRRCTVVRSKVFCAIVSVWISVWRVGVCAVRVRRSRSAWPRTGLL